jgi:predicted Zn-dependent peptidase
VPERVDLRILPEGSDVPAEWRGGEGGGSAASGASPLDETPRPGPRRAFTPPEPVAFELACGARLVALPRAGSGLFAGALYARGGPGVLASEKAGLAALATALLGSGAGGRDAAAFAAEVELLGASIEARAERYGVVVAVDGLASRLDATLDRFADVVLRPNLAPSDFTREKALLAAAVAARADDPAEVAHGAARALALGRAHPCGAALEGYAETVAAIEHGDVAAALAVLLDPANATFVFAGDFEPAVLAAKLNGRFDPWEGPARAAPAPPGPIAEPAPGRVAVVDRPGAAQTRVYLLRAIPAPPDDAERAARDCVNTILGESFTSRLNQNLRERNNYAYGAGSRLLQEGPQHLLAVSTAVHTPVTGAALGELCRELGGLATGDVTADELAKAKETLRARLMRALETTDDARDLVLEHVAGERGLDAHERDLAALDAVTLERANALARSGLYAWAAFQVVLVGDRAAVVAQLEAAGFGVPLAADAEGRVVGGGR